MTAIALVPSSKYWAGASRPFYVSQGMVTSYLTGKGFTNVRWHKRSEALPTDVVPSQDSSYDDDWDEWVSAEYSGPTGSLNPPTTIPWLIVHMPSVAQPTPATTPAPAPAQPSKPSWVTSSAQASQAAQSAAQQAQAASGAASGSGVSSVAAALATPPTAYASSAPRAASAVSAGAALFTAGVLLLLGTIVTGILGPKRR